MSNARQIWSSFPMVGTALVIQGWQQEEDRLAHLGGDECRTADGSEGEYSGAVTPMGGVRLSNTTTTIGSAKSTIIRLLVRRLGEGTRGPPPHLSVEVRRCLSGAFRTTMTGCR
jgi:hypothetical protein